MKVEYESLLERAKRSIRFVGSARTYELPELEIVSDARHTVIKNFSQYCSALNRDPKHVAKFLFKELAIPGDLEGNKLVLFQKFSESRIRTVLEDYFKTYVVCRECNSKDTVLMKQGRITMLKCEACGATRSVPRLK